MCGIAGVAFQRDHDAAVRAVMRMNAALARRGPDGVGLHGWPEAVLGHRRLAVFDTTQAGAQPMLSADGRIGVVFNGAIYNFRELRHELETAYRFRSRSDTEVLIHGYRAWGIDGLALRLHGMFAIGLWDDDRSLLYLVRDRLGVKPLVYAERNGSVAFASHAAALNAAGYADALDGSAVAEFLEYGFVTEARSIYQDVKKLPPGHIGVFGKGKAQISCYWSAQNPPISTQAPFNESVDQAEDILLRAVAMRLDADVPVGALLSGGVDSSLVCWAIRKLGKNVTAFTAATPLDPWDESADARATAERLGLPHRVLNIDPDTAPPVSDMIAAFGEPFACASALGLLTIAAEAKKSVTVLLTGDGGDDIFLGYPRHLHYARAQQLARYVPVGATPVWRALRPAIPMAGAARRAVHFIDYALGGLGAVVSADSVLAACKRDRVLGERFRDPSESILLGDKPWSVENGRRVLDEFILHERRTRFSGEYLTKVDGATMYHGIEARAPFLDQDLWSFCDALPYGTRLHGGRLKAILRELARRHLGPRVANGKKRGFGIPVQRWLSGRWRATALEAFEYSVLDRDGWLRADQIQRSLRNLRPGETAPLHLWHAFVLEQWMKTRALRIDVRNNLAQNADTEPGRCA